MQQYDNITLDVAEQALRAVSPDMPRKEWARMALAMYDEFGDAAFDAWDRWSQGGATYDPKAAKTTWRSCSRASGATRVGVAAVIWAAQQTGWTLPSRGTPRAEDVAKMAAERARRDRERAERRAAQDAAAAEDHAAAADLAQKIWAASQPAPADHPYLVRKGITRAEGVRFSRDWLIVPMMRWPLPMKSRSAPAACAVIWKATR